MIQKQFGKTLVVFYTKVLTVRGKTRFLELFTLFELVPVWPTVPQSVIL